MHLCVIPNELHLALTFLDLGRENNVGALHSDGCVATAGPVVPIRAALALFPSHTFPNGPD